MLTSHHSEYIFARIPNHSEHSTIRWLMTDDTLIKEWLNALERVSVSELSSIATFCHLTSLSMDAVIQCMYLIGSSMFMYSLYSRVALAIPLFDIVMFDIGSIWIEIIESFCHFVVTLTIWTIRIHRISI